MVLATSRAGRGRRRRLSVRGSTVWSEEQALTTLRAGLDQGGVAYSWAGSHIAPRTVDDLGQLIRLAGALQLGVVPVGSGAHVPRAIWPRRPAVTVATTHLAAVEEHAAGDLTVTVGAGMKLQELDRVLAAAGQRLPVDCADRARSTVGGALARGDLGPRRLTHGGWRDLVLGVALVDGRGTAVRSGGRVVKNVAGYDLGKLVHGSLGSLGVVTCVTLRLAPVPEACEWVMGVAPDVERAAAAHRQVRALPTAALVAAGGRPWEMALGLAAGRVLVAALVEGAPNQVGESQAAIERGWQALGRCNDHPRRLLEAILAGALEWGGAPAVAATRQFAWDSVAGRWSSAFPKLGWTACATGLCRTLSTAQEALDTARQAGARVWSGVGPVWHPGQPEPAGDRAAIAARLKATFDPGGLFPGVPVGD